MIQSMTGYGRAVAKLPEKNVIVEVKSLNSKQMDVNTRVASLYRDKDLEIRNYLSSQLVRGKVDFSVYIETKEGVGERVLQESVVKSYYKMVYFCQASCPSKILICSFINSVFSHFLANCKSIVS